MDSHPARVHASNEGGGSIQTSYLNGVALPWVYCIDIPDNVGVPADYDNSRVAKDGTAIFGSATIPAPAAPPNYLCG